MAQRSIPIKTSNRKAREERLLQFEALAAFANMGDSPQDWLNFRRDNPRFFPDYLTEWIYRTANDWWRILHLSETPPDDWMELHRKWPDLFSDTIDDWAPRAAAAREAAAIAKPPLLFYRDLLRGVWRNDDADGSRLLFLLGFELESLRKGEFGFSVWKSEPTPKSPNSWRVINEMGDENSGGIKISDFPKGRPVIDRVAGAITWEFGCSFQRAIYDLMQDRWRAMVCPQCHKYFIADKTAQKFCSTKCTAEAKQKKSLEYYYRKGRAQRSKAKTKRTLSERRKKQ